MMQYSLIHTEREEARQGERTRSKNKKSRAVDISLQLTEQEVIFIFMSDGGGCHNLKY